MRPGGGRAKGHQFERDVAAALKEVFPNAKRGLSQTRGGGKEVADVDVPYLHIECKRGKRCNPKKALRQALRDCVGEPLVPVAVTKDDRDPVLVTMYWQDWVNFLRCWVLSKEGRDEQ